MKQSLKPTQDRWRQMIEEIAESDADGVGCADIESNLMAGYVDMLLAGEQPGPEYADLQRHVAGCPRCSQEVNAMLQVLRAEEAGQLVRPKRVPRPDLSFYPTPSHRRRLAIDWTIYLPAHKAGCAIRARSGSIWGRSWANLINWLQRGRCEARRTRRKTPFNASPLVQMNWATAISRSRSGRLPGPIFTVFLSRSISRIVGRCWATLRSKQLSRTKSIARRQTEKVASFLKASPQVKSMTSSFG